MKFLDMFKKKVKEESRQIVPQVKNLNRSELLIHNDLQDLIWFKNGPKRNYYPERSIDRSEVYTGDFRIVINFSVSGPEEPSVIDTKLVSREVRNLNEVEKLPYYPSYSEISPEQRGAYLKFLENPYNTAFEVGYAFILYYGLERFLLTDKFEPAFEVVLKLRDVHPNSSFQSYSGNALVLSCLYHKRPDMMVKFIESLDKDFELTFSDNLFLLSAYSFELPLYAKDIVRLAKTFEFTNKNYMSKYPDLFIETMTKLVLEKYKKEGILLSEILNRKEFSKLRTEDRGMFANISISDEKIRVPMIAESFKIKKTFYDLLEETHESVKKELADLRKKGSAPEVNQKSASKEKKLLVFDENLEEQLLSELKNSGSDLLRKHFAYIQLQDFYYKYRDIDSESLTKCIYFCEEDIRKLDEMHQQYISSELNKLKGISAILNDSEIESRKRYIEKGFQANIPAFKRLAIIYEKNKDYDKAIEICDQAVHYYQKWGMDANEFLDRKKKLIEKKNKN
ncbi:TerB N-terminal domain-containing protein [Alkalibacterium sp. MB6]|uniref:TerB N-terminal domain-containing protein n=1 Tax=Alkalibacterium sp. MB6 TaxID=2081965 RepID=UPI00137B6143|nr:TerB N-terminal domain-containing protein [Alkalibacterium sp. MB6]